MKVKNIVFSGIMAAILGATAADAAISVASQAYVDGKIKTNADAISELSQTVADNKTAADATATLVGTLPEGATATTIVGYITEKTTGIASDQQLNELGQTVSGQGEKITALETLTGENGQIAQNIAKTLQDAKDYAAGLATNYDAAGSAAAAETAAKGYTDTTVAGLDADQVGADGSYIKLVSQADGKVSASAEAFVAEINESTKDSGNAPSVAAVTGYITEELAVVTGQDGISGLKTAVQNLNSGKADKATTLAGYGITDAYTKTEVDGYIDDATKAGTDASAALAEYKTANDAKVNKNAEDIAAMDAAYKLADTNLDTTLKAYADQAEADAIATAAADATSKANAVADTLKFLATAEVPSECTSGSAYCVLTMTTGGAFAWTPLTSPVE